MSIHLHWQEQGSGFPLILLHGNGESSEYFEGQLAYFSKWFRVIAPDTRGHGDSPRGNAPFSFHTFADDLLDFMNDLNIPKAHILGFSDGAITAILFALKHCDRIERLVLNGANLYPEGVVAEHVEHNKAVCEHYRAELPIEDPARMRKFELVRLMVEEPDIKPEELSAITVPTLVIAGDDDMIIDAHTRLIFEHIPHAELAIIPGDHFISKKNPDTFNQRVKEFLLAQ